MRRIIKRSEMAMFPIGNQSRVAAQLRLSACHGGFLSHIALGHDSASLMNRSKLRRQIAWHAARLMYQRQEAEYYRAKMKAARHICQGWVKPADLPSNAEIRDEIQALARVYEGDQRLDNLRQMRLEALRLMRILRRFRPRLIGSVMTGHIRQGSDIDLHVFSDTAEAVTHVLDHEGLTYTLERKQVRKHGEERVFTHVHIADRFPMELTVYPADKAHYVFKSSITGKAIERASIAELEQFLAREYPATRPEHHRQPDLGSPVRIVAPSAVEDRGRVLRSRRRRVRA
jgi:predicted nucleotidyltransferase